MNSEQNPISSVATNRTEAPQHTLLDSVLLPEMLGERTQMPPYQNPWGTDSQTDADARRIKARAVGA